MIVHIHNTRIEYTITITIDQCRCRIGIVVIAIIIVLAAWLFERTSREVSLVRTGLGGRKVVMDGGVIVLPYFHRASKVNMQTMRLEVSRHGEGALITKDRLRVDVGVEFYISVEPTEDSIARASQTLGNRTFDADKLLGLLFSSSIICFLCNFFLKCVKLFKSFFLQILVPSQGVSYLL